MRIYWFFILVFLVGMFSTTAANAEAENRSAKISEFNISAYTLLNAYDTKQSSGTVKPDFYSPHDIVEIYFKAVSNGELTVFNRLLDKSMLIPLRIEYIYEINSDKSSRKIYSELKQPMDVPGQECCRIHGISAILDADGHIIETEIHIWAKK